jgi:hypothetical protein
MPKKPRVIGLEGFRLSLAGLKRLGDRPVRLTVQLVGRSVSALRHLRPRQREARLRDTLADQLERLRRRFDTIEGRSQNPRRHGPRWFCVWGVVAVQIEEQVQGFITLEDRLVLVRANDPDDAQHKLQGKWSKYAEPYLNPNGYLVRWQLVNVRDVYELFEDTLDPRGTEVYSRLRKARLRPEYRWRPTGSTNRTRSN